MMRETISAPPQGGSGGIISPGGEVQKGQSPFWGGLLFVPLLGCGLWRSGRLVFGVCWLAAFGAMWWLSRRDRRWGLAGLLTAGLVLRVLFGLCWPADSDVNRYVIEGVVQLAGGNPYALAPGDADVAALVPESLRSVLAGVNHKDLAAAYPPLAELYCRLVAWVSPTVAGFKTAAIVVDMLTCVVLAGVLRRRGLPLRLLWLYVANPLVLVMTVGEGHLDVAMLLCLSLGLLAWEAGRSGLGFVFFGAAAMVKYPAAVAIPFFVTGATWRKVWLAALPLALFAVYAGDGTGFFGSLATFAGYVSHGGPLVLLGRPLFGQAAPLAAFALGAMLVAAVWLVVPEPWRGARVALVIALASLPTVYPWYVLPLVPLWLTAPGWALGWLMASQGLVTTPDWLRPAGLGGEGWLVALSWLPLPAAALWAGRQGARGGAASDGAAPRALSVVVPTLDEAGRLGRCLAALEEAGGAVAEVIVVDGGSRDATAAVAKRHGVRLLAATGGRGGQIAAGVAACTQDVVLVLHADALCAPEVPHRVLAALGAAPEAAGGAVGMAFADAGARLGLIAGLNALRTRLTGISFGDQGQFFRRSRLDAAGGFPAMALMEDVELALRLLSCGGALYLGGGLAVSGRRWQGAGYGLKVAGVLRLFATYLLERRLGLADASGRRYYERYYGRPPHQTAL